MLEHAVFTFEVRDGLNNWLLFYLNNCQEQGYKYFVIDTITTTSTLVSANLRAIIETNNNALMYSLVEHYDYLEELEWNGRKFHADGIRPRDNARKVKTFINTNEASTDR